MMRLLVWFISHIGTPLPDAWGSELPPPEPGTGIPDPEFYDQGT